MEQIEVLLHFLGVIGTWYDLRYQRRQREHGKHTWVFQSHYRIQSEPSRKRSALRSNPRLMANVYCIYHFTSMCAKSEYFSETLNLSVIIRILWEIHQNVALSMVIVCGAKKIDICLFPTRYVGFEWKYLP